MNTAREEAVKLAAEGMRLVDLDEMQNDILALGYKIDLADRNYCTSRYKTGERAGEAFPCAVIGGIKEVDTGIRAFNKDARRDSKFDALQSYRGEVFALVKDQRGQEYVALI